MVTHKLLWGEGNTVRGDTAINLSHVLTEFLFNRIWKSFFFLPLDFLDFLSLQQPVDFFLCNRVPESDDTAPAFGVELG